MPFFGLGETLLHCSPVTLRTLAGILVSSGAEFRPLYQWDLGDFFPNLKKKIPNLKKKYIYRGYSNFLLNMTFISSSESGKYLFFNIHIFHFTSEIKDIFNKNI